MRVTTELIPSQLRNLLHTIFLCPYMYDLYLLQEEGHECDYSV